MCHGSPACAYHLWVKKSPLEIVDKDKPAGKRVRESSSLWCEISVNSRLTAENNFGLYRCVLFRIRLPVSDTPNVLFSRPTSVVAKKHCIS